MTFFFFNFDPLDPDHFRHFEILDLDLHENYPDPHHFPKYI